MSSATPAAVATSASGTTAVPGGRAPNIFALRPAATTAPGELRTRALARAVVLAGIAAALLLVVVVIKLRFPTPPPGAERLGPLAVASLPGGGLALLLDEALLLHARSGLSSRRIDAGDFGLASLAAPLVPSADGSLLLRGREPRETAWHLLRCNTAAGAPACVTVMPVPAPPATLAVRESFLGDALFLHLDDGRLLRTSSAGEIEGEATTPAPPAPAPMLYREGLLLIPAPEAPLLGVYRPDRGEFGRQLDALFLLTPTGAPPARQIIDIAATDTDRYALLEDEKGRRELYRFDASWGSARRVDLTMEPSAEAYLATWRDRLLLVRPGQRAQTRIAPGGRIEVPFESTMLAEEYDAWERAVARSERVQRFGLIAPMLIASILSILAGLQAASARALSRCPPRGTALLDPMPAGIHWLPTSEGQTRCAQKLGGLLLLATVLLMLVAGLAGPGKQAVCLLPAVLAAMQARVLLLRGCGGHFGRRDGEIVAVDHDGRYFYGPGDQAQCGAGFLFVGALAIPVTVPGLEALSPGALSATTGEVDEASAIGLLWYLEHPWLRAAVLFLLGLLVSGGARLLTA